MLPPRSTLSEEKSGAESEVGRSTEHLWQLCLAENTQASLPVLKRRTISTIFEGWKVQMHITAKLEKGKEQQSTYLAHSQRRGGGLIFPTLPCLEVTGSSGYTCRGWGWELVDFLFLLPTLSFPRETTFLCLTPFCFFLFTPPSYFQLDHL